ncbi:MAG: hypothetical protein JWQ90_2708 [Hydrocarboniphaga sp.]|uniref:hypothetical protein n=1 Tax=Hydrocarboniphaga sp. TaxID=2033016 RepID=UPI00260DD864|nr:hypothetical protein [Hydrocarboniphaga sp.]MDB5970258.1 hypothetical protein [Hydrocarboniphaga sp.]
MSGLFAELRRRNVLRALAIYAGAAWLLVQVATQVFPFFDVPNWAVRWVVIGTLLGIPLVVALAWIYEFTPDGLKRERDLDPGLERPPLFGVALGRSGLLIVAVGAVLLLGDIVLRHWPAGPDAAMPSMAVMPFKNLGGAADESWFTDGIQDEIQSRLSKIGEFRVISRSSASYYASRTPDLRQLAQQLGVSHIVEGSVQRRGESARIIVQLIAANTGAQIWSETYDRQLTNVFDVESEVALAIVDALRARLTPAEQRALSTDPTHNAKAYDAYLRGMAAHRRVLEPGYLDEAAVWFAKAVELDPGFALAWARLARVNADRAYFGLDLTEHPCEQARHAAETAWRLQPDDGETDLARGFVRFMCDNDLSGAEQAFASAVQRLPNSADALRAISQIEWQRSNWPGVLKHLHDAAELDPRNSELLSTYALYLLANRQFDPARQMAARALAISPDDATLKVNAALIEQADGQLDAAQHQLDALALQPAVADVFAFQMLQRIYRGRYQQARSDLQAALAGDLTTVGIGVADYYVLLATVELAQGDAEAARQAFAGGHRALKTYDNGSITDNSAAGVYLRSMLCLTEVGEQASALDGADCIATRRASHSGDQFALNALEVLAQAEMLAGNRQAALAAITTLLQQPYMSGRYRAPLTPALLRNDPIWAPLRDDAKLRQRLSRRLG